MKLYEIGEEVSLQEESRREAMALLMDDLMYEKGMSFEEAQKETELRFKSIGSAFPPIDSDIPF